MKRQLRLPLACLGLIVAASTANAVTLVPGGAVLTPGSPSVAGTLLATTVDSVVGLNALSEVRFTGTLTAEVVQEAGGTLDFWYQYSNDPNSLDGVARLTMTDFSGFSTDVDWLTDNTGSQASTSADRSGDGATVGFSFTPVPLGEGLIEPDDASKWVVIRTNATQFTAGTTSVIDAGVATVITYAPLAVPEPASLLALGIGVAGLLRLRRKAA